MKSASLKLVILMPVYNDWDAAGALLERIDSTLAGHNVHPHILLIDDGSATPVPDNLARKPLPLISAIDVLRLRRNLGHQRAIAIGLTHIFQKVPCDAVVVMDADGEDRPEDVPRLMDEFHSSGGEKIIFAQRTKRLDTLFFRICYRCYQILHRALTGLGVKVGNFSIIPFRCLSALVVSPELWNHYAAAVIKLGLPVGLLAAPRGVRLFGKSEMNFISLFIHGMSAISVFGDIVSTRIVVVASGLSALLIGVMAAVVVIRLFTDLAVPGWATYTSGLLLILFVLILSTTLNFLLSVLGSRHMASFIPLRDCSLFVHDIKRAYPADE